MEVHTTRILTDLMTADKRFVVVVGGARAGKSVQIAYWFITKLMAEKLELTIARQTRVAARDSVWPKAMKFALEQCGLWNSDSWNATTMTFTFENGSAIQVIGASDEQKLRGREADYVWINEANELDYKEFMALNTRCRR